MEQEKNTKVEPVKVGKMSRRQEKKNKEDSVWRIQVGPFPKSYISDAVFLAWGNIAIAAAALIITLAGTLPWWVSVSLAGIIFFLTIVFVVLWILNRNQISNTPSISMLVPSDTTDEIKVCARDKEKRQLKIVYKSSEIDEDTEE